MKKHENSASCPVEDTLTVIGSKWTVLIIRDLLTGVKRFGQLERSLDGISPRTLSLRLSSMEHHGIVDRKVFPEVPPRVEYKLTALGRSLEPVLKAMQIWGISYQKRK